MEKMSIGIRINYQGLDKFKGAQSVGRKAASHSNPTTQKGTSASPKKHIPTKSSAKPSTISTRAKQTTKAASSQPNSLAHTAPKQVVNTTLSQPTSAASGSGSNKLGSTSSQNNGKRTKFFLSNSGDPHVSPKKLRQKAKLPPRKWRNL
ncbi:hypothetical protein PIB30_046463 [Stylosanthes scabra]|uniref:Uncharacterized protein n=1 Tax=Stylosanthes scabra TaxID=79078 RepID=A0ABU6SHE9_9FABA|nr:hypothetical protein [Stylosanthes scabra]